MERLRRLPGAARLVLGVGAVAPPLLHEGERGGRLLDDAAGPRARDRGQRALRGAVVADVKRRCPAVDRVVYAGFSQGVAMAYRAAARAGHRGRRSARDRGRPAAGRRGRFRPPPAARAGGARPAATSGSRRRSSSATSRRCARARVPRARASSTREGTNGPSRCSRRRPSSCASGRRTDEALAAPVAGGARREPHRAARTGRCRLAVKRNAQAQPRRPAIVFYGREVSFAELDDASDRFAGWLRGARPRPGRPRGALPREQPAVRDRRTWARSRPAA